MRKIQCIRNKAQQRELNMLEQECKKRFLRKLSKEESIRIFMQLHEFASDMKCSNVDRMYASDKIKTLARIHNICNKVK